MTFERPKVMGILNVTPDSFYSASRKQTEAEIAQRTEEIISQGGEIIDIGACSTRPNAIFATEQEEVERLQFALQIVRKTAPKAIISIDTFRPAIARMVVKDYGADIINDVGIVRGGIDKNDEEADTTRSEMFHTIAELNIPYILMSSKATMEEVMMDFAKSVEALRALGVKDIVLDPGFGFGKTIDANYNILSQMAILQEFELPILAGLSRKSMIWKAIGCSPEEALNGTTILNTIAIERGADILRVHDVRQAVEVIQLVSHV